MRKIAKMVGEQTALIYGGIVALNLLSFIGVRYTALRIMDDINRNNFPSTARAYREEVIQPLDRLEISLANPAFSKIHYDTFMAGVEKYKGTRMKIPITPNIPKDYRGSVMVSNSGENTKI